MTRNQAARDHLRLIQRLFNASAERHRRIVEPVFAPLYDEFARYAAPRPTDCALDVGTGTGPVARRIMPRVCSVIGVDVARSPLIIARKEGVSQYAPTYVRADLHHLPFPAHTFTLITASFALNAADPDQSLRELRRVLAPGGRIVIQEWGPVTALDQAVADVLADYVPADPPPDLAALREWIARDLADCRARWTDHLQEADDYREWLRESGFEIVDTREYAPVTIHVSVETFIACALAGTDRAEEIRAMDGPTRAACDAALRARLADFADSGGLLRWEPVVIRAVGRAPGR
jgi:ubiquinone/menaquinone biosynthesis C-methylase UbiE